MVLCSADGSFGSVVAMFMGWRELVLDRLLVEPMFKFLGTFVIELVELRFAPTFGKCGVYVCNCLCDVVGCPGFDRLHENAIAVKVVCYYEIVVAMAGWLWEASCLVGVHDMFGFCGG